MSEATDLSQYPLVFSSATRSHRGNVRKLNEDSVFADPVAGLWMVADGMGGHEAGDLASRKVAEALANMRLRTSHGLIERIELVEDRLIAVNDELQMWGREKLAGGTVGTTVVVFIACDRHGVALWAGDSRLYRSRGGKLEQVTRDHNPMSDLLDVGEITEAEALTADSNVITRAVGGHGPLCLDVILFDIEPGDLFLLCSDGLYRELSHARLEEHLRGTTEQIADRLISSSLEGVAQDNVSLVVIQAAHH
jgi:serine/threonine protein phosphatase PrpC